MRVLVTGATSLIGVGVARSLAQRKDEVIVFQRGAFDAATRGVDAKQIIERRGDIGDSDAVANAASGCDAVIHLAAKVGITGDRADFERANVAGTQHVIDAARAAGIARVVHVSSPSVAHDGTPIIGGIADPAITSHGAAWYPETKALGERIALRANSATLRVVAIRPHLVWGPGDTQLVGRIVERAEAGKLALVGGGRALIDTTYIDNAVDALVAAVDALEPGATCAGRAYVVSNGEPRPIRELVAGICAAAGVEFAPRDVPLGAARRVGAVLEWAWPRLGKDDEPPLTKFVADQLGTAHWFDPRPLRDDIGWVPTVSIDEGLRRLGEWFGRSEATGR